METKMKKILVSGAGGYIGSVMAYMLLQAGFEVIGLDNFTTGFKGPLDFMQAKFGKEKVRYYAYDLRKPLQELFDKEKNIEAVIQYAAVLSVNESMKDPAKYFSNNVCGTQNLLDTMMRNDIKKVIFSSTCAVYGDTKYSPVDEDHPTNPKNPYGESKRIVERMLHWYGEIKDLQYVALRYFNVCGATDDGLIGDAKKPSVHLMQNAVRGALGLEPFYLTCPTVDTPDKTPIRDYVNVVDLNDAHLKALDYLTNGGTSQIMNLGTGNGNSVLEIVNAVQSITGKKFDLQPGEARQGEYARAVAKIDKARKLLGWEPEHSLEDSVKSLVTWYNMHPKGWEA
jgi:UDP-glucose 4-epimerase